MKLIKYGEPTIQSPTCYSILTVGHFGFEEKLWISEMKTTTPVSGLIDLSLRGKCEGPNWFALNSNFR